MVWSENIVLQYEHTNDSFKSSANPEQENNTSSNQQPSNSNI